MKKEDLEKMKAVDIQTVEKDSLVDISSITINKELPPIERVKDFLKQIKNPYCYVDHGIVVKISFTGQKSLEDCLKSVMIPEINI